MKHVLCLLILAAILFTGCGAPIALIDSQEARAVADKTNAENWAKVRTAQLAFIDSKLVKLDTDAAAQIANAPTGQAAAATFAEYLQAQKKLEAARLTAATEYDEALDNAFLQAELTKRQTMIVQGWYGMFRFIPGVETAKTLAEAKAREYVKNASTATNP